MTMAEKDTSEKKRKTVICSGNTELDSKMGGGLPFGSLCLIEGSSGAGKSVLTQQILKGALNQGLIASLFTSENTVKSLVTQMQSIDLDILDFLLLTRFKVFPVELARLGQQAPSALLGAMKKQVGRDLIVVDSFTSAIAQSATNLLILSFFEECKRLCATGMSVIVTLHAQAVNPDLVGPIRSMCDAHLQLRSEQDGQRLVKTLEVAKIRGAASVTGAVVGFDVEPGWGMRVIPISKARG
ncbi:MAG TPA: ATPase domain-containing protein [Aggregatilineales bacterium]|nr:ATPase domain-containing protein [Aggregatilineales bacterium]